LRERSRSRASISPFRRLQLRGKQDARALGLALARHGTVNKMLYAHALISSLASGREE
jgi:hypothetical protein